MDDVSTVIVFVCLFVVLLVVGTMLAPFVFMNHPRLTKHPHWYWGWWRKERKQDR